MIRYDRDQQAIFFSLLLGFGISIGSQFWQLFSGQPVLGPSDSTCAISHYQQPGGDPIAWYRQTIPQWFYFLVVPGYSAVLSLRNQAVPREKEFPVMVSSLPFVN